MREADSSGHPRIRSGLDSRTKYRFEPAPKSPFKVWEQPVKGMAYAIGVDVGDGVPGGDLSCANVVRADTMEQVAELAENVDPYRFAEKVVMIAEWYNYSQVAVESNGHGLAVIHRIRELGFWNLYTRRAWDMVQHCWTNRIGWQTTVKTKPLLIDHARECLRDGSVKINSKELLEEMLCYVLDDAGRANAMPGKHDDRVMAWMIALQLSLIHI